MNLLSLKAVFFDTERRGFYSPSRTDFCWPKGIVVAQCDRCQGQFTEDCTCGIYSSPNPDELVHYDKHNNTVYALLAHYGWIDIWPGPNETNHVIRAYGARIVGVVGQNAVASKNPEVLQLSPDRQLSAAQGAEFYGVKLYSWAMAQQMIRIRWRQLSKIIPDPYDPRYFSRHQRKVWSA
jgi:hypothetical protein